MFNIQPHFNPLLFMQEYKNLRKDMLGQWERWGKEAFCCVILEAALSKQCGLP